MLFGECFWLRALVVFGSCSALHRRAAGGRKMSHCLSRLANVFCLCLFLLLMAVPLSGQMKLREELINQQQGGYVLASFSHGSVYTANFSKRDDWSAETRLPPPADHVQDGLLSPDGKLIALFFQAISGPYRFGPGIIRRDGSDLRE